MSKSKKSMGYYVNAVNGLDESLGRRKSGQDNRKKAASKASDPEQRPLEDSPFAALANLRNELRAKQYEETLKQQEGFRAAKKMAKVNPKVDQVEEQAPPETKPETKYDEKDDQRFFMEAMKDVVPISGKNLVTPKPLPPDSWSFPTQKEEDN
ncbi:MAG: hypothetical protein LBF38_02300, partial [Deltaproteobacteria bacterium]|nr:hypothetical protein [Deltaproteobacteria bacterium]